MKILLENDAVWARSKEHALEKRICSQLNTCQMLMQIQVIMLFSEQTF